MGSFPYSGSFTYTNTSLKIIFRELLRNQILSGR